MATVATRMARMWIWLVVMGVVVRVCQVFCGPGTRWAVAPFGHVYVQVELQPIAPAVLPDNPGHVVITPDTGVYPGAAVKFDRVFPVQGHCERGSNS